MAIIDMRFWVFWIFAALLTAVSLYVICAPLLRRRAGTAPDAAFDVQVYKDQLGEIEKDLARGVLAPTEAEAARTEVSRRLLGAAEVDAKTASPAPQSASRIAGLALLAFTLIGGGILYSQLGTPGYRDQPLEARLSEQARQFAERPRQAEAEAAFAGSPEFADLPPADPRHLELIGQLRTVLAERPMDVRGHRLLADNLGQLGLWSEASVAQLDLLELLGGEASGRDFIDSAEYMVLSAGGYVSPEAETQLSRGVRLAQADPKGRYYSGLLLAQAGRPDLAYNLWANLLMDSPPGAPWIAAIEAQIPQVAAAAGLPVPSTLPGPDAQAIADAQDMAPEDRQEMIRGMVSQLAERLNTEGGLPEEWARLIRAYGVLGELRAASDVWNEARVVYADEPQALNIIRQAARDAEVVQ